MFFRNHFLKVSNKNGSSHTHLTKENLITGKKNCVIINSDVTLSVKFQMFIRFIFSCLAVLIILLVHSILENFTFQTEHLEKWG